MNSKQKPTGVKVNKYKNRQMPVFVTTDARQAKFTVPKSKKDRKRLKIPKDQRGITPQQALARASALAPTRLTLNINQDTFLSFLRMIAVFTSYEIQAKGSIPLFATDPNFTWNPSTILAYLIICATGYLSRIGSLPISSQYVVAKQYKVPTFVAKWFQQCLGKAIHMDRNIVSFLDATAETLLAENCGTGGLGFSNVGLVNAPCYIPTSGDNEGWYSVDGTGQTVVTPQSLQNDTCNKISSIMDKTFENTISIGEVSDVASTTELKITPVAEGFYGDLMYAAVDPNTMCDLTLPLSGIYNPDLLNSFGPTQCAAPVRIDGGLCASPQSKVAFLFWLANSHKYNPKDSFIGYLRKFGVKDKHLGNLQINLRQLNWNGVLNACMVYLQTFTSLGSAEYWYFVNYVVTILLSNIPGCFRAVCPISRGYSLAPLYRSNVYNSVYSSFTKNPKMPPFLAQIVEALRAPIRYENQISFFINVLPEEGTPTWWSAVATGSSVTLGSDQTYGQVPSCLSNTGMVVTLGPYRPYPNCVTAGSIPSGYPSDSVRNYYPIYGIGTTSGFLSGKLTNANGDTNLYNQWGSKAVQFTKRLAKYILVSSLSDTPNIYPPTNSTFGIRFPIPELIASWEPGSYHTACLAVCMPVHYYSPTQNTPINPLAIGPVFSADPVATAADAQSSAHAAASPGQGTSQAVVVGKSNNPQEVQGHMAAEAAQGVIPDSTEAPPKHLKTQVEEKLKSAVKTSSEDVAKLAGDVLGDAFNKIF